MIQLFPPFSPTISAISPFSVNWMKGFIIILYYWYARVQFNVIKMKSLALATECQCFPNYFNKWSEFCQVMWKYMPWGFFHFWGFISEIITLSFFHGGRTPFLFKRRHEALAGFQRVFSFMVLTALILIDLEGFFILSEHFSQKILIFF